MSDLIDRGALRKTLGIDNPDCQKCSWRDAYGCSRGSAFEDACVAIDDAPSAEPETAKRIVGCARNGMTMWYQCDMCHEPVDEKDAFCRGCGRRFEDE